MKIGEKIACSNMQLQIKLPVAACRLTVGATLHRTFGCPCCAKLFVITCALRSHMAKVQVFHQTTKPRCQCLRGDQHVNDVQYGGFPYIKSATSRLRSVGACRDAYLASDFEDFGVEVKGSATAWQPPARIEGPRPFWASLNLELPTTSEMLTPKLTVKECMRQLSRVAILWKAEPGSLPRTFSRSTVPLTLLTDLHPSVVCDILESSMPKTTPILNQSGDIFQATWAMKGCKCCSKYGSREARCCTQQCSRLHGVASLAGGVNATQMWHSPRDDPMCPDDLTSNIGEQTLRPLQAKPGLACCRMKGTKARAPFSVWVF